MLRPLYWLLFKLSGWKVDGTVSKDLKKFVLIVVPHTSMWDFPIGLCARSIIGHNIKYVGKKELFWFPLGILLKAWGGYPVDREKGSGMVDSVVQLFNEKEEFKICLAPEGTRSKVTTLKSGFWHMAKKAGVPIIMVAFDYPSKRVVIAEPLIPGPTFESDLPQIMDHFRQFRGKHPEKDLAAS